MLVCNGSARQRNRSQRVATVAVLALASFLLLGGCWRDDASSTLSGEPITLQLITFDIDGPWGDVERDLIAGYQEMRPNVEVEHLNYGQFPQQYLTMSPPPDIMAMTPGYFLDQAAARGQIADLTDVWQQTGLQDLLPDPLQTLSRHGGKQYYLPVGYTWTAVYYNTALFGQVGLAPPATWDDFMLACDTLLANGVTPFAVAGEDPWQAMLWIDYLTLRLYGAEFHDDLLHGQVRYDDSRVREAVELWSQLLRRGCFLEDTYQLNGYDSILAIVRGDDELMGGANAAMVLTGPAWLGELPEVFRSELDFFPFPAIDPLVSSAETISPYGYMVPLEGRHVPETLSFLTYVASADAQQRLAQRMATISGSQVPASGASDRTLLSDAAKKGTTLIGDADAVVTQYMPGTPEVMWQAVGWAVNRFLREPDQVDAFLLALEGARQQALDQGSFQAFE